MTSGKAVLTLALSCYWAAFLSAQPRIFEISTNTARLGDDIIIYGDDFNPPEAQVLIGGAEAEVIDGNVAYLQVHVPGGALPGPIVISQSGKVAASSAYFNPLPVTPGILTNLLAVRPISSKTGFAPIAVVADLDGDSRQDIVAATEHSLEIFRNKGGPGALITSNWFQTVSISAPQSIGIYALAAGDLDGDGKPELIYSEGEALKIRQNQFNDELATNSFGPALQIQRRDIFAPIRVADVDHDGRPDILGANASKGIQVFWNRSTGAITTNAFTNTFVITSKTGMKSQGVRDFDVADLNQDRHADIAAIVGTNLVVFALQDASGMLRTNYISSFILGPAFETGFTPYLPSFAVTDLNGDGVPDIVVRETAAIVAYINHSTPDRIDATTFEKTVLITSGYSPILAADFDGDGQMDLLVESRFLYKLKMDNGKFVALTGRDRAVFEPDAVVVALGDFNGDNRPDAVALPNLLGRPLAILQNFGFTPALRLNPRLSPNIATVRTLDISGPPMSSFLLEFSMDLIHWFPMTDVRLNAGGEISYNDLTGRRVVFYRLRQ